MLYCYSEGRSESVELCHAGLFLRVKNQMSAIGYNSRLTAM
jgi:hypothetical protein